MKEKSERINPPGKHLKRKSETSEGKNIIGKNQNTNDLWVRQKCLEVGRDWSSGKI